jgi:arsenate reductase
MADRIHEVLFLCTGNSARSILAECALRRWGGGRFRAHSAGSRPRGEVHPETIACLRRRGYDVSSLRSKSWDAFAVPGAPVLDFVFTVCDQARAESCPVWPGQPMTAHWGVEDPAAYQGPPGLRSALFDRIYVELEQRVKLLAALPVARLDRLSLQRELERIGKTSAVPER